jgi:Flp pilus assembly protein TadG
VLGRGRERGSSVVEFALVLPVVLLVLLAVVQVTVVARDRLLLAQAARAGAREAAITGADEDVGTAVRSAAPALDPARLAMVVTRTGERGTPVTVALSYSVPVASVLAGWLLPATVDLREQATARQEFGVT